MGRTRRTFSLTRGAPLLRWILLLLFSGLTLFLAGAADRARTQTLVILFGATLVFATLPPLLRRWINYVETYCHEVSHGLAGLLVGGRWHRFRVDAAGGGHAVTSTPDGARKLLVVSAGYLGVICIGSAALALAAYPRLHWWTLLALAILFAFPILRSASFLTALIGLLMTAAIILALVYVQGAADRTLALRVFGALLIAAGLDSLRQLLLIVIYEPHRRDSDAHVLGRSLHLPPLLVTLMLVAISLGIVILTLYIAGR